MPECLVIERVFFANVSVDLKVYESVPRNPEQFVARGQISTLGDGRCGFHSSNSRASSAAPAF